jgi:hypothetical protein
MTPDLRDVDDIEARIAEASGTLAVAHAQLVELTVEVIERDLWRGGGFRSVSHWLTLKAGLSHHRAHQIVELATRSCELPATVGALAVGEITFDQAHTVAQHAPAHVDVAAADLAKVTTVAQLRSSLSRYRFGDEADECSGQAVEPSRDTDLRATRDPDRVDSPGRLTITHRHGRVAIHVDTPAHEGALIEAALAEARDHLFHAGQSNVTWYDALAEVCARSAGGIAPARRDRYRVYVHLDTEGGWLNAGLALPQSLMRSLTCDADVVPLWHTEGKPIAVGRTRRVAPGHTRRVVADRDRGCRFPGCGATRHLEQHHIVHWADGGRTDPTNLVSLCPSHHDAHHRGEFHLTGEADGPRALAFADQQGRAITLGRPRPPNRPLPSPPPGSRYRSPSGERFNHSLVSLS